ncbi:MAG TPA: hypothetical protein VHD33_02135, partial [Legionellaceae bacterium]|nr:hypothetical protein [Legionellaceae bacterium]
MECIAEKTRTKTVEYWETENRPPQKRASDVTELLESLYTSEYMANLYKQPFLPRAEIEAQQLQRIQDLVGIA